MLPSRFVDELPAQHVDAVSETGYVAPSGGFYGSEVKSQWDRPTSTAAGGGGGRAADGGGRPQGGSFNDRDSAVFDNTKAGSFRGGYDSPGWRRAQAASQQQKDGTRGATRPPDIDGRAFRSADNDGRPLQRGKTPGDMLASSDPAASSGLKPGNRIFHDKFGYGRVTEVDGAKLTVNFEKAGVKKVVESFVKRV